MKPRSIDEIIQAFRDMGMDEATRETMKKLFEPVHSPVPPAPYIFVRLQNNSNQPEET